jgi:tRNA1(Val) A37 N6-methylase TrmN6
MTTFSCEKCGKGFNSKSHYTQHTKRKTPCVNESKVKEMIEKSVEEKLSKLNIPIAINPLPVSINTDVTIESSSFDELKNYYDKHLNMDKSTYKNSNDEPTPIDCISEMISKIPSELWSREQLSILDPCCGNGNFSIPILFELLKYHSREKILEEIMEFNDTNESRLENVRKVFCKDKYALRVSSNDFIEYNNEKKYDLIVANPPYAKFLENGKRASKNHNLIKDFIEKALSQLKEGGYLLFITPDNWMSYADRNILIKTLTDLQIIHLDIHSAKKYFKKIGSSFTWYVIENKPYYKNMNVSGIWKKKEYISSVESGQRRYIPLLYNEMVRNILSKTVDNIDLKKFEVKTSSDLHKYTKKDFINENENEVYKYKLIHTPSQTVYASRPHKYQEGYKVFISTTDKYKVFIDECGMTQSIVFILCSNKKEAEKYQEILEHPLYVFINNICRWGNFNNIRILQSFPIPDIDYDGDHMKIFNYFKITEEEINFMKEYI